MGLEPPISHQNQTDQFEDEGDSVTFWVCTSSQSLRLMLSSETVEGHSERMGSPDSTTELDEWMMSLWRSDGEETRMCEDGRTSPNIRRREISFLWRCRRRCDSHSCFDNFRTNVSFLKQHKCLSSLCLRLEIFFPRKLKSCMIVSVFILVIIILKNV